MKQPQTRAQRNLRFALRVAGLLAKGFAVVFILLVLVVCAGYLALPHIIDAESVKETLTLRLQEALRRPVRIQSVIMTPHGIKLTGFKVLSADGQSPFIEGEFALVTIKLRELLRRRVELSNFRLASPRIQIARDEQGNWSFADVFTSSVATLAQPRRSFSLPLSLAADQTSIESGRLEVDDRMRGTQYLIERFNLAVSQFDVDSPFTFALSFDNVNKFGARQVSTSLSIEGEAYLAALDWPQAYVKVSRGHLNLDGREIKGAVSVTGFPLMAVEGDVQLPALAPADWEWWLQRPVDFSMPPASVKFKAQWLEDRKARVDSLEVKSGALSASAAGLIDLSGGQPRLSADVQTEDFPLDQAATYHSALERFALKGYARAEASVTGWPGRWKVDKAHLRLRDTEARFAHWRVQKGDADLAASEDFAKVAVTLSSGAINAFSNPFSDITLSLKVVKRDLRVDYVSVRWADSKLRLKGRVLNLPDPHEVLISGTLDRLHWERAQSLVESVMASISTRAVVAAPTGATTPKGLWVQTFKYAIPKRFPDTIGRVNISKVQHKNFSFDDMDLLWDIRGVTPELDTASGDIRVGFGPGRVADIQAVQDSHKFLRIVFLPYIYMHKMNSLSVLSAATAYPKTIDFTRIQAQYGVERGIVTTRFCHVDSPQLAAYADGTADFGRERVDMNILTRLSSYRAPLPEWWVDELGRPAIGFRVKGDLNRPDLEPRLHKMAGDEIERTVEDGRRRASARFESLGKFQQLEGNWGAK